MRPAMTGRQKLVLEFFREFFVSNLRAPTLREIQGQLGIKGASGVLCHLTALVKKGYLLAEDKGTHQTRWRLAGVRLELVEETCLTAPTAAETAELSRSTRESATPITTASEIGTNNS